MNVDMQLGHGLAAWMRTCTMDKDCSMDMDGHTAGIRTCRLNIDKDIQHRHEHAAWTCTCSLSLDIPYSMDFVIQHGLVHAAQTWTMDMHHGCRNADKKFSPASLVFPLVYNA